MFTAHRAVVPLLLLAACTGGANGPPPPRLDPPAETGNLVIDMTGDWVATAVTVLEQIGGNAPAPAPPTRLFPPVVGSTFTIGADGYIDLDGADTAALRAPDGFSELFASVNWQNGAHAILDIGRRSRSDPAIADAGSSRVQCSFGSVAIGQMSGLVRIESIAGFVPAHVPRLGLYRIELTRR